MSLSEERALPLAAVTRLSPLNPRQDMASDVSSFAATLRSVGQLHPILVRHIGDSLESFEVLAGGRRWRAMRLLQADTDEPLDIKARLFTGDDAAARMAALAEATTQKPLHPVEEVIAFRDLASDGCSLAQIADAFGEDERHVRRRLALAGLAPELLDLWRRGEINRDIAQAFAAGGPSEEAQRAAVAAELALPARERWSLARIRRALRGERVTGEETLGRFFLSDPDRLAVYRAMGGRAEIELFEEETQLLDRVIARRAAQGLLLREAERVAAEEGFGAGYVMSGELPDPLEIEPDHTAAEEERHAAIAAELSGAGPDAANRLTAESDALHLKGLLRAVSREQRKTMGVACDIAPNGGIEIIRFIPAAHHPHDDRDDDGAGDAPEPAPRASASAEPRRRAERQETKPREAEREPALPPPRETREMEAILAEAATGALRERVAADLGLAFLVLVAALGCSHGRAGVNLALERGSFRDPSSPLLREIAHLRFETALACCAAAASEDVAAAFAELAARAIDLDGVEPATRDALLGAAATERPETEPALRRAFPYGAFFEALPREEIVATLREIAGEAEANEAARLARKKPLAERAALRARDAGWLPEALRRGLGDAPPAEPGPLSTAEAMVAAIDADEAAIVARAAAIDAFLAERCRRGPDAGRVMASDLHAAFLGFAARRGAEALGHAQFGAELTIRGLQRKRAAMGIFYVDLALIGAGEEEGKSDE
jgi:ParB family chromosome partitioning protein